MRLDRPPPLLTRVRGSCQTFKLSHLSIPPPRERLSSPQNTWHHIGVIQEISMTLSKLLPPRASVPELVCLHVTAYVRRHASVARGSRAWTPEAEAWAQVLALPLTSCVSSTPASSPVRWEFTDGRKGENNTSPNQHGTDL